MDLLTDNYDTKNWYVSSDKIDTFISNTLDKLPLEILKLIIDDCYDDITFPYSSKWWDLDMYAFGYGISAFVLIGDTDEIKNLQIVFARDWGYDIHLKNTRATILHSNCDRIVSGQIFMCDQYFVHNKIVYPITDPSKLVIKRLYPKQKHILE